MVPLYDGAERYDERCEEHYADDHSGCAIIGDELGTRMKRQNVQVKSIGLRIMFLRTSGALQMIDSATDKAPAARRRKSTNAQTPISFLETIADEM